MAYGEGETCMEFVSRYYEFDGENYVPATIYREDRTYYYRQTYALIQEGGDITNAFLKYEIELRVERDANDNIISCKIIATEPIKGIASSIKLTFAISVNITNTTTNTYYPYSGFYYKFIFVGYND